MAGSCWHIQQVPYSALLQPARRSMYQVFWFSIKTDFMRFVRPCDVGTHSAADGQQHGLAV